MRLSRMAMAICSAAAFAAASEIRGRIHSEGDWRPVPGALVRLLARGDSVRTDSDGAFRFEFGGSALRPRAGASGPPRMRAGNLEYWSPDGEAARLDLFGIDGRLLRSLAQRPASPGMQRVDLAPWTEGPGGLHRLRGLGWLRIRIGARKDWIRILAWGSGALEAQPVLQRSSVSPSDAPPSTAGLLAKAAGESIDTLIVEKPGFIPLRQEVRETADTTRILSIGLRLDPVRDMDPAEVLAWQAHLNRPAVKVRIGRTGIRLPDSLLEGKVILADGTEARSWQTDRCHPGPRPTSIRLAYARQGREYRDTLRLAPLWNLFDSYRVAQIDTIPGAYARLHLVWDWPKGFSATPGRDWMVLKLTRPFAEDAFVSYPNVFREVPGFRFEGGETRYDPFDPAGGAWIIQGASGNHLHMAAVITWARRDDHDARVVLDDGDLEDPYYRFAFTNAWPEGGIVRPGQVIRVQADLGSLSGSMPRPLLESIPEGAKQGTLINRSWDGSALDWTVPEDIRDTVSFRLKAWVTDELHASFMCGVDALSPVLRVVPP